MAHLRNININSILAKHKEAVEKLGKQRDILEKAQKENDDWNEISSAIGGDGKTLRKYAQIYTLGFLVAHANAEIKMFNSLYEL